LLAEAGRRRLRAYSASRKIGRDNQRRVDLCRWPYTPRQKRALPSQGRARGARLGFMSAFPRFALQLREPVIERGLRKTARPASGGADAEQAVDQDPFGALGRNRGFGRAGRSRAMKPEPIPEFVKAGWRQRAKLWLGVGLAGCAAWGRLRSGWRLGVGHGRRPWRLAERRPVRDQEGNLSGIRAIIYLTYRRRIRNLELRLRLMLCILLKQTGMHNDEADHRRGSDVMARSKTTRK